MKKNLVHVCAALASIVSLVKLLPAQEYPRLSAAVAASATDATSVLPNGTAEMSGKMYGGEGSLKWRTLSLRVAYSQGSLGIGASSPGSTSGDPHQGGVVGTLLDGLFGGTGSSSLADLNIVDAHALLGWNPFGGLEIGGGLQGRAFYTDDESERLLLWVGRARYEAPVVPEYVSAFLEGWHSFSGTATEPQSSVSGRGGVAGIAFQYGRLRATMSYSIDRAKYSGSSRVETIEGLGLGVGVALGSRDNESFPR
jgi:hypothetical protein